MVRPFRFGVTLFPVSRDRDAWQDQVRRAASNGFSAITVTDHFGTSGGIFSSLVSAWEAAPTLRVGTLVLNAGLWNPVLLAREVATCDAMTNGHLDLGVGAGWNTSDYLAAGVERANASQRIALLSEVLDILYGCFGGQSVQFSGEFFNVSTDSLPPPYQTDIPLLIGGGSRQILELAGRRADIVSLHRNLGRGVAQSWREESRTRDNLQDPVAERVAWVREAAGPRFESLELHALIQTVVVASDRRKEAEALAEPLGVTADDILESPHYLIGSVEEMATDLKRRRDRWGISYWTLVGEASATAFAPVARELEGA